MRAGRGAAVGVVAKGVNVHATLGTGILAGDIPSDLGRGRFGVLLEDDRSGDLRVTSDDTDWETWKVLATTHQSEWPMQPRTKLLEQKPRIQAVDISHIAQVENQAIRG